MEDKDKIIKIQKTASTLYDLMEHTDLKYCKEIATFIIEKTGDSIEARISTENFMALVVSRFYTNHQLLELMAKRYGKELQIIELGAGFSPHFLNLDLNINKYIEVELEENSRLKEEITKKLTDKNNIYFVSGDILSEKTWNKIQGNIDTQKPVLIFCEGVIAHYFNSEQKETVAAFAKKIMVANGSCFVIDDTLRNHPELQSNPIIIEGMGRIVTKSGSDVYKKEILTFDSELSKWSGLFNNETCTIDYLLSKPEMDFAIKMFKLIVCINDEDKKIGKKLLELSKFNRDNRIWK